MGRCNDGELQNPTWRRRQASLWGEQARLRTRIAGEHHKVTATAFQQYDCRDFMKFGVRWPKADSPYAQPDRKVAREAVQLTIYQTPVDMKIARPADDLDPERGVLRLQCVDGGGGPV